MEAVSSNQTNCVRIEYSHVYMVNCSHFLAIRVLRAIPDEDCTGKDAVHEATTNAPDVRRRRVCTRGFRRLELTSLQTDLISVLTKSDLELRKWLSNSSGVVNVRSCGAKVLLTLLWPAIGDYYFGCTMHSIIHHSCALNAVFYL